MFEDGLKVELRDIPELNVAYVRHVGSFSGIGNAFERLMQWAGPKGLVGGPDSMMLSVYHDDPNVTREEELRSDAAVVVPEGTEVSGEIRTTRLPAGKFAVGRVEVRQDQFGEAWGAMMGSWLPGSGYRPAEKPCYEICLNDPARHPEGKFVVELCLPVIPL